MDTAHAFVERVFKPKRKALLLQVKRLKQFSSPCLTIRSQSKNLVIFKSIFITEKKSPPSHKWTRRFPCPLKQPYDSSSTAKLIDFDGGKAHVYAMMLKLHIAGKCRCETGPLQSCIRNFQRQRISKESREQHSITSQSYCSAVRPKHYQLEFMQLDRVYVCAPSETGLAALGA